MKKKKNRNQHTECRDRLTSLPDSLITTLFPLLSMKESFFLCNSSKSLQHFFHSIPSLDFREYQDSRRRNRLELTKTVTKFLEKRVCPIKTFTLSFNPEGYTYLVTKWINLLKRIGVSKIVLDFMDESYKIPDCLFNLKNVKVLSLESCTLKTPTKFPGFRLLEVLQLENVRVREKELGHIISKCPSLNSLTLCGCDLVTHVTVLGVESKLETLYLEGCGNCSKVNVPSLENFHYSDVEIYLDLGDGTQPTTFKIDRGSDEHPKDGEVSSMENGLLKNLNHVQYLSLTGSAFTCFALAAVFIMPTEYSSLVKVEVELSLTDQSDVLGLFCLLQRAKHVESLILLMKNVSDEEEDLADWEGKKNELACGCLTTLKKIQISRLGGKDAEVKFVKFVLVHAVQLQIMTIIPDRQNIRHHLIVWRNLIKTLPKIVKIVVNEDI